MSCSHLPVVQMVRPGSSRVLVTELSGSGHINPTPATKPTVDSETALGLCLSPEQLESLCGTWDLSRVTSLEICIDTQENSLGNIGASLPNLVQLKLNNSVVMSVRDLGLSLSRLQVLWMSRCCLRDLDGIFNFSSIKELYVAFNSVSDLNHVGMLDNLELLDLEGNDVDDLVQVQYLALCSKLQRLTLEGNPVCVRPTPAAPKTTGYRYRAAVRELLPQLHHLDNVRVEEDGLSCSSSTMGEEWAILRDVIRDRSSSQSATEDEEETAHTPDTRPSSARRPASSFSCVWPIPSRPHTGSRPTSATGPGVLSPLGSRPGSADSALSTGEAERSTLTHGAGKILFCGNPVQAIRAKREKLRTAPTRSTFTPRDLPIHVPEHTYDLEELNVVERGDVIAELRAWRETHSRRLQAIETERRPQVLTIQHIDEAEEVDDDGDDDDDEVSGGRRNDSSDGEDEHVDNLDAAPDFSFQSLSPALSQRGALSPDVARLSLSPSPDATMSPCPPVSAAAAPGIRKPQGIRARRLRVSSQASSEHLSHSGRVMCSQGTGTTAGYTDLTSPKVQPLTRTNVPVLPKPALIPHVPSARAGQVDLCMGMDSSCTQSGSEQRHTPQMSKLLDRPAINRPHTARAALQKHQQHRGLQPCRGSLHKD